MNTRAVIAALLFAMAVPSCGRVERAWPDGTRRFEGQLTLSGERDGEWTFYYPDGSRRESGRYEDGLRVGIWRQWHMDGELASEGARVPDPASGTSPRDGLWLLHYPDGSLRAKGMYRAGEKVGYWEYYDEDGVAVDAPVLPSMRRALEVEAQQGRDANGD